MFEVVERATLDIEESCDPLFSACERLVFVGGDVLDQLLAAYEEMFAHSVHIENCWRVTSQDRASILSSLSTAEIGPITPPDTTHPDEGAFTVRIPPPPPFLVSPLAWAESERGRSPLPLFIEDYDFAPNEFQPGGLLGYKFNSLVTFKNCTFLGDFGLRECHFPHDLIFEGCTFANKFSIAASNFKGSMRFVRTTFKGAFSILNCEIRDSVDFDHARIENTAQLGLNTGQVDSLVIRHTTLHKGFFVSGSTRNLILADTTVAGEASFTGTTVLIQARFSGNVIFEDHADFQHMNFHGPFDISGAEFKKGVSFRNAKFAFPTACLSIKCHDFADFAADDDLPMPACGFNGSTFHDVASFDHRVFRGATSFEFVNFVEPPSFHNATLFGGTTFRGATFGDTLRRDATSSFRALRKCAAAIESYHDELAFFALELRARRRRTTSRPVRFLYLAYEITSAYGLSIYRPLLAFLVLQLLFFGIFSLLTWWQCALSQRCIPIFDPDTAHQVLTFTMAQGAPFIPAVKDAAPRVTEFLWKLPLVHTVAQLAAIVQGVFSVVFLFLAGLGLRNLFRLK